MSKVRNENYYVVHGFMLNELGLKGNALSIYAIIYGFSQAEGQEFTGSISYLCDWLGVSRPTVINTLKELVEAELITKTSMATNGVVFNSYRAVLKDFTGSKEILLGGSKNFTRGSKNSLPNNINNNTKDSIDNVSQYEEIIEYLNKRAGTSFSSKGKDTRQHINARLSEGHTVSDFKKVIDAKVKEWKYNEKMSGYLRPKTLFGTKFEDYLQQYKPTDTPSEYIEYEEAKDEAGNTIVY